MSGGEVEDPALLLARRKAMRLFGFRVDLDAAERERRLERLRERAPAVHSELLALMAADWQWAIPLGSRSGT